jgi:hypothetical protein
MAALHITDPETDILVRRLAASRSMGITEAIKLAVINELAKDGTAPVSLSPIIRTGKPLVGITDRRALERELEEVLRSVTLDYTRILAKERGTKSLGSRVYQMIARYGAVGTLARLVDGPTDGLTFLKSVGRLDLAAENIALDPRYESLISEDIRARAKANLDKIGA